jgi:CDP-diacylglycerol--serine O-phosphatidyltransferase
MIYVAALFDFLDGFAARLLKATSEIGKSLDSLADVISFGLLPSAILYYIIKQIIFQINPAFSMEEASFTEILLLSSSLLIVAFSALRLANFNVDTRQIHGFIGVPTPAVAMLISSFPFILNQGSVGAQLLMKLYIIVPLILVLSFLMVSEIPMIALKFKSFSFARNVYIYLLIAISIISMILWGVTSVPVIFLIYIIFSLLQTIRKAE